MIFLNDAIEFLRKDYIINASILEPILTGTVEVLYADSECVLVKDKTSGVLMMQTENLELARKLLKDYPQRLLVAHNQRLSDMAIAEFGFSRPVPCYQAVYRGEKLPVPENSDFSLRLMREDEAQLASDMYFENLEEAVKHIRLGYVYGGYVQEEFVGMVGLHLQGAMGLLEVDEKFRRRGYGEILERYLINHLLDRGLVPYCHVVEGNEPSLSLQRKLGLEISKTMLYWIHKENKG